MTGIQLPSYPVMALAVTGLWLLAACLLPCLPDRIRSYASVTLIALGVPSLGWLTLLWGPGIGVASLALGLLALIVAHTAFAGQVHGYTTTMAAQLFAPDTYKATVMQTPGKLTRPDDLAKAADAEEDH